jgi:hypothetical protein
MSDREKTARRYRFYAEQLRAMASEDEIAERAQQLRSIADGYDDMALSMEVVAPSPEKPKQI